MTMPDERTRAIQKTREFLRDLIDPVKMPKVPKSVRDRAYSCLRHYPGEYDLDQAAKGAPNNFGPPDPSYRKIF